MQILKIEQYLNEKLNITPVSKTRLDGFAKPAVDERTKKFITSNGLEWNPSTRSYDCKHDIKIYGFNLINGKLPIRFGIVIGSFEFDSYCYDELVSLEGSPRYVGKYFDCSDCKKLGTLEGAPQMVVGGFDCRYCGLSSLKGAPIEVGDSFYCSNNNLESLEGAPKKVGGGFECNNNNLKTLNGAPQEVRYFKCDHNFLKTLEGAPQKVDGDFDCCYNLLTSLKGLPKKVGKYVDCSNNRIKSIDVEVEEVGGNMIFGSNKNFVKPTQKPSWLKGLLIDR